MNVRKKLNMLERFFVRTGSRCTHPTCEDGECLCDDCMEFMREHGEMFNRRPGDCQECMGTTWKLVFRPPLDENGVPMKPPAKKAVAVDCKHREPRKKRLLGKPRGKPRKAGNAPPTARDWKNRGKK